MRKKRIPIVLLLAIVGAIVFYQYKQGLLAPEGNYYENLSDFDVGGNYTDDDIV